MRVAIVSDIHGNLAAFEAVLADLRDTAPDLIYHGGDIPHGGSSPAEVVDRIRDLAWPGVLGNTDEMLFRPESLTDFFAPLPQLQTLCTTIADMADFTRDALGEARVDYLRTLPLAQMHDAFALVHASPASCWRSPAHAATDQDLETVYAPLARPLAIYGHIHVPFVRRLSSINVVNTGSVSLSYDGDTRASYLLIDNGVPQIRRVAYDVDREVKALAACGLPHAAWVAKSLISARPEMP
jgi:putative phosphoesterase